MSARWEDTFISISRSYLEYDIWVPNVPDDDLQCFEYAGHQFAVKRWVIEEQLASWAANSEPKTERDFKWIKTSPRQQSLWVRVTA